MVVFSCDALCCWSGQRNVCCRMGKTLRETPTGWTGLPCTSPSCRQTLIWRRECFHGVEHLLVLQAVVELTEKLVDQVPNCCRVMVTLIPTPPVVVLGGGMVGHGSEAPYPAGGGESIVLDSAAGDGDRTTRGPRDGRGSSIGLQQPFWQADSQQLAIGSSYLQAMRKNNNCGSAASRSTITF